MNVLHVVCLLVMIANSSYFIVVINNTKKNFICFRKECILIDDVLQRASFPLDYTDTYKTFTPLCHTKHKHKRGYFKK